MKIHSNILGLDIKYTIILYLPFNVCVFFFSFHYLLTTASYNVNVCKMIKDVV